MSNSLDSLFALANKIIEIGYLMTRLIAMPIPAFGKHGIEFSLELILASKNLNESFYILRNIPSIVASGTFCDIGLAMDEVLIVFKETTICFFARNLLWRMATIAITCLGLTIKKSFWGLTFYS